MSEGDPKIVRVAELKAHLSAYLRAAQRGRSVIVCDRDTPLARLVPIEAEPALLIRPPSADYASLQDVPLPPRLRSAVDAVALLLQDRGSGR